MSSSLLKIKEAQSLHNGRGNEINRNYWKMVLADSFPKIIEEQNGVVTIVEFMGNKYQKVN